MKSLIFRICVIAVLTSALPFTTANSQGSISFPRASGGGGDIPANAKWDMGDTCNGSSVYPCAVVKPGINE